MTTSVTIDSVTKRFGDSTAVDDVSFDIAKGEFFTLLGSSGCGKTTLLRMVAGFLRQTSGHIRFGGRIIDDVPPHQRNTGMVFQNYAIFPHLTVFDNIAYGLRARGRGKAEIDREVKHMLELVQLGHLAHRRPRELSGGQQQRVVLARAMVIKPDVLLMDEPLSNLDTEMRIHLRSEIRSLQRQVGITTIYVTHDQEEALLMSDRIAVMSRGRVEQLDVPHRIYAEPQTLFVARFIGENNLLPGTVIGREADGHHIIELPGGHRIRGAGSFDEAGSACHISIRPQDIDLAPADGASPNTIGGTVTDIQFLGGTVKLLVEIGAEQPLQVSLQGRRGMDMPSAGSRLKLDIPLKAVRTFKPEARA
ncbi:spermidine/putrescine import ATP-binding protein PotA [Kaistia sp. 32K]|uniref:ABC transporter ATP-binding protein n=1 Tax=Kaistia sp. 32K TaxID=2795690 RepID=UPI0019166EB0|nr:ABC transporter ATP-binding protein [Kaistia sp. 32K]BCP55737.1 spermidine/putrescine import ATP-binding protein PotA [Kaistia sp. 32K]